MSKSRISRGGIAPPHGLMRPARSSSRTLRPRLARSVAAVAPDGPPPTTTASNSLDFGRISPSCDRNCHYIASPYRGPCRSAMNPDRHRRGDDEETGFRGKDGRIRKRRRRQQKAGDIARHRSEEAAEAECKGLSRTP